MLRSNRAVSLGLGVALLSSVSLAWAQGMNSMTSAGVRNGTMLDLSVPSVSDPAAIEMLFREGNTITSILDGLNEKGFHIRYKKKHFLPEMTLLALPESTRIDEVLREILEPWNFSVYHSPMGQWVVTPNKKKTSMARNGESHDALKSIVKAQEGTH